MRHPGARGDREQCPSERGDPRHSSRASRFTRIADAAGALTRGARLRARDARCTRSRRQSSRDRLAVPVNAEQLVGNDLSVWERGHFPLLSEPVPLVTFACQWLRRNLPPMRSSWCWCRATPPRAVPVPVRGACRPWWTGSSVRSATRCANSRTSARATSGIPRATCRTGSATTASSAARRSTTTGSVTTA